MITDYYKLREEPFGVTPDSRLLYSSPTHREALASLAYGIEARRGFVALIAKPGMGKTTLLFELLKRLQHRSRVVFLFQTICTPLELLQAILADLGVQIPDGSLIELQRKLNEVIRKQSLSGRPVIVVIDEAQNLEEPVLEAVRMLSNYETAEGKLIQIILCGQPQLADRLASPALTQLRQRISIFARLNPLSMEETELYIKHRLRTAGYDTEEPLFTPAAISSISHNSEGIPRNINNLCFNALSLACVSKKRKIDSHILSEVVADLDLQPLQPEKTPVIVPETKVEPLPSFLTTTSTFSRMMEWIPKVAAACAILLALSAVLYQAYRWVNKGPVAQTTANSTSIMAQPTPRSPVQPTVSVVHVTSGQSLTLICAEPLEAATQDS